ncbi:unnamed protein product [Paramecium octaurelia]|uniref:Uncharacterized protein n=1 Tax=Paramecium octaurelia TaxID=43137 RepID=A0A8S1YC19_PAROT|nr:unnamed protein product [Paramecium octaurelia]
MVPFPASDTPLTAKVLLVIGCTNYHFDLSSSNIGLIMKWPQQNSRSVFSRFRGLTQNGRK